MAIIPAEEKVFMVSNSTNTIYSGSASLKAMQQWYTMQDVIDSVSAGGAPTLQQVTEAGNTATQTIIVSVEGSGINGIEVTSGEGIGVQGNSSELFGGYFASGNNIGLVGASDYNAGVLGQSSESNGVYGYSNLGNGVYGTSTESSGVFGSSTEGYGVYGSSETNFGGYFDSQDAYSLVAGQSAAKPGGGSWSVYSDSRIKENVTPYTKGLADILLVNTVTYEYNGLAGTTKGAKYTGIIAQEIKEIFPDTVKIYKAKLNEEDEEKTELYDFNASDLTFALINAIKELNEKIKILEAK
jgi:hypothetical protein